MSLITDLYTQAQLAEAAYADLDGAIGEKEELINRLNVANKISRIKGVSIEFIFWNLREMK